MGSGGSWPGSVYVGLPTDANGYNPLDILDHEHQRLTLLCDVLESIADELPGASHSLCSMAAKILKHELPVHHVIEDECLFPVLRKRVRPEDNLDAIFTQLEAEHASDDSYSKDLIECLESMGQGVEPANPEMVGYMLRAFFESYRRHMALEERLLFPLARARLTPEDLRELLASIVEVRLV